jgi:hypothetical protein
MSKLHDDLINEIEPCETVDDAVNALMLGIADRIEGCNGNAVKLSDLVTILREDTKKVADAAVANTNAPGVKTRSTPYDAPATAFDKPRENVRTAEESNDEVRRDADVQNDRVSV